MVGRLVHLLTDGCGRWVFAFGDQRRCSPSALHPAGLTKLDLWSDQFQRLPPALTHAAQLQRLLVVSLKLQLRPSDISSVVARMPALTVFHFKSNVPQLRSVAGALAAMPSLQGELRTLRWKPVQLVDESGGEVEGQPQA